MKNCSDCGQPFGDQFQFCPDDGAPLIASGDEWTDFDESDERPTISEVITGTAPLQSPARETSEGRGNGASLSQVLRCPGCGSQYPRTFASCPIDGFRLTSMVRPIAAPSEPPPPMETAGPVERPASESERITQPLDAPLPDDSSRIDDEPADTPTPARDSRSENRRRAFSVPFGRDEARDEAGDNRRGSYFPRSLILVLVGILALAALYLILKGEGSDRPAIAGRYAANVEGPAKGDEESSFIETPEAARTYEEPVEEEAVEEAEPSAEAPSNRVAEVPAPARGNTPRRGESASPPEPAVERPAPRAPVQQGPSPGQIAAARMNEVARQAGDSRVNARLTRVRGRRTASGYRYDLTFTLQSQSQLSLYWDKLLISTRSAGGTNNSMVVPFSHNLGASGSMTFTISVEMRGAGEADWQGRITCTSLGRDASGRLTRAAFSTSVAPG
ncbi:MAG TPA: hypothetical protein VE262_09020 [Blastocatellia bacterium]|nr:hypothetical protein [Blastocatellia bacterium]